VKSESHAVEAREVPGRFRGEPLRRVHFPVRLLSAASLTGRAPGPYPGLWGIVALAAHGVYANAERQPSKGGGCVRLIDALSSNGRAVA
jgi:hypothetical protein